MILPHQTQPSTPSNSALELNLRCFGLRLISRPALRVQIWILKADFGNVKSELVYINLMKYQNGRIF